ncbi:MAG: hypothetical protein IKW70_02890 [Verrucomicrobia bacterium]|nr:hypothetical protein [Verrucomicrobiota bacterium]MBO4715595.1 hypothetical protein [Verrucomicrobiota bacterium]MBR5605361.1 hypothetical protein [Verrucomicrobiota bacterium]MBR5691763.1 hypothetical protein [Verrucomicrobiota bacterium]MBR5737802.1 hypothetical protein [Verrucomicrobiota bacterium]
MLLGAVLCLITAFIQSVSYIFSRIYIAKNGSAFGLAVYSQLWIGIFSAFLLPFLHKRFSLGHDFYSDWTLFGIIFTILLGQVAFFKCSREIEASRLSSLTGLKLVILVGMCFFFQDTTFSALKLAAVCLCTIAAVGMNFSGTRISLKGGIWMFIMLVCFCECDILIKEMISSVEGENILTRSLGAVGVVYTSCAVVTLPLLAFTHRSTRLMMDALPCGLCYFAAMIFLFVGFSLVDVVFANIIVSSRGIISVLIGALVSHWGMRKVEPAVGAGVWKRRLVMSVLMVTAMALYSFSH